MGPYFTAYPHKRAQDYKSLGALEEVESPTLVQKISEPERIEHVIPAVIGDELVLLPKKHDDVFCGVRKETRFYITQQTKKIRLKYACF